VAISSTADTPIMAPPINEAKGVNSVVMSGQSAPILIFRCLL
jgi:hypothetical protein